MSQTLLLAVMVDGVIDLSVDLSMSDVQWQEAQRLPAGAFAALYLADPVAVLRDQMNRRFLTRSQQRIMDGALRDSLKIIA